MTAPWVCGYVTHLGYLYCAACVARLDLLQRELPGVRWHRVLSDVAPHNTEPCEACGKLLIETNNSETTKEQR